MSDKCPSTAEALGLEDDDFDYVCTRKDPCLICEHRACGWCPDCSDAPEWTI